MIPCNLVGGSSTVLIAINLITRCHSTEDDHQNPHCHEDLKSSAENIHASGGAEVCITIAQVADSHVCL